MHDVGKAFGSADHASVGAELLEGVVAPRVVWLVRHHLDLLDAPGATKRRLRGTAALRDLQVLRAFDVGGRKRHAEVRSVDDALSVLFDGGARADLSPRGEPAPVDDDEEVER